MCFSEDMFNIYSCSIHQMYVLPFAAFSAFPSWCVCLSRYLLLFGCSFLFVLRSTVTLLVTLCLFAQTVGYGPDHTTGVYIDVWVELQRRGGESILGVELPYSLWALPVMQVVMTLLSALCAHIYYDCLGIAVVYGLDKNMRLRTDAIQTNSPAIA